MQAPQGPFCQSCAIPMDSPEKFGTEADGEMSEEYCVHCYQKGEFTQPDATLEGMMDFCADIMAEKMSIGREEAKAQLKRFMPQLKRWREKGCGG